MLTVFTCWKNDRCYGRRSSNKCCKILIPSKSNGNEGVAQNDRSESFRLPKCYSHGGIGRLMQDAKYEKGFHKYDKCSLP